MASTNGVAEAAAKSLLMFIHGSLIHCGSMYLNNHDVNHRDYGSKWGSTTATRLKSTSPAERPGDRSDAPSPRSDQSAKCSTVAATVVHVAAFLPCVRSASRLPKVPLPDNARLVSTSICPYL